MADIQVHAGDFPKGRASITFPTILLSWEPGDGFFGKTVSAYDLESVELASEESVKRIGGAVGWGVVGGALLGPVGLLAGLLAGGRGKDVTFAAKFKDGRKMLATTDSKTYTKIQSAVF